MTIHQNECALTNESTVLVMLKQDILTCICTIDPLPIYLLSPFVNINFSTSEKSSKAAKSSFTKTSQTNFTHSITVDLIEQFTLTCQLNNTLERRDTSFISDDASVVS